MIELCHVSKYYSLSHGVRKIVLDDVSHTFHEGVNMGINATKKTQKKAKEALVSRLTKRAARHLVNKTDDKAFKPTRGLAFLGALGWNIPIPTFLGILLGRWMDAHHKVNSVSWTLNFLLLGLLIGMAGAWFWLKREGIDYAQKSFHRTEIIRLDIETISAKSKKAF